jgi:hypothetical protein
VHVSLNEVGKDAGGGGEFRWVELAGVGVGRSGCAEGGRIMIVKTVLHAQEDLEALRDPQQLQDRRTE